jgi:arylsulfatase A-like enzyme
MDRNIGRIIADLRTSGQLDNTLILFLSDNGACAEWEPFGFDMSPMPDPKPGIGISQGTPGMPNKLFRGDELATMGQAGTFPAYGSAWANASNTPWRLYKHYGHEGGISNPFIAHWPAAFGEGIRHEPAHLIDLMATCVDVSGAKYPTEFEGNKVLPMEGVSLRPWWSLPDSSPDPSIPRMLAWEHEGNRAIREGKWKLVSIGTAPWELYDIGSDRLELQDLAANQPERVKEMSAKWELWAKRTHVLPRPNRLANDAKRIKD